MTVSVIRTPPISPILCFLASSTIIGGDAIVRQWRGAAVSSSDSGGEGLSTVMLPIRSGIGVSGCFGTDNCLTVPMKR